MQKLYITNQTNIFEQKITEEITRNENVNVNVNAQNNVDIKIVNINKEITIEEIRNLIKSISNKPTSLKNKYAIIYNFNKANINAQNAFLKTLEEANCIIFLQANNISGILDTILSRVVVEKFNNNYLGNNEILELVAEIFEKNEINKIPELSKKYDIEDILNNIEIYLQKNNIQNKEKVLKKLFMLKKRILETNINKEIQLFNLFVN